MFEVKTPEEIDAMSIDEFQKYSDELAASGQKAEPASEPAEDESQKQEDKPSETKEEIEEPKKGDDDDEDDEDEEETNKKDDGKPLPMMSLKKYNKSKQKFEQKIAEKDAALSEVNAKLDELKTQLDESNSKKDDMSDDEFKDYIEKTGADPEVIKGLIGILQKKVSIDPSTQKRLAAFEASQLENAEKVGYDNDFNSNIATLIRKEDPDISAENLEKAKEKLREIAYSDKYFKYDLKDVYLLNKSMFTYNSAKKKTAETSRPSAGKNDQEIDYSEITPEDIDKMSNEEFEKYSDHMAKATGTERFKINP